MHQIQDQSEVRQAALDPLLQSLGTIGERHTMLNVRSVALANGGDQSVEGPIFALQGDAQLFGDRRWARLFGSHKQWFRGLSASLVQNPRNRSRMSQAAVKLRT